MSEMVFMNARGEMVMPYHVFKALNFDHLVKSIDKNPYPPKVTHSRKRQRPKTKR